MGSCAGTARSDIPNPQRNIEKHDALHATTQSTAASLTPTVNTQTSSHNATAQSLATTTAVSTTPANLASSNGASAVVDTGTVFRNENDSNKPIPSNQKV